MKNTVTRHVGTCQICQGDFKLDARSRLVHHGYRRPGWGEIVGDCPGVGEQPLEASCEFARGYGLNLAAQAVKLAAEIARLAPWAQMTREQQIDARELQQQHRGCVEGAARLAAVAASWKGPTPLRTVEELEGPKAAERAFAASKRADAKAEKVRLAIEGYRSRLDSARRRRNPRTISEIFESAQRKLRDLGAARTGEEALALLDRAEIFSAFGLQGADYWRNGANGDALGAMFTYDWPGSKFEWPASLA